MEHPLNRGSKVCINGPGHITKMTTMPINGKNLKNLLLWNRWADFNETWYVASRTLAHCSLYKSRPWVVLDLFYGKVNIGYICFSIEKSMNINFLKVVRYRQHVELLK